MDMSDQTPPRSFTEILALALNGEWRFDQLVLDEQRMSGCLVGSLGNDGMMFMEMNIMADEKTKQFDPLNADLGHITGLMTFVRGGQIHTATVPAVYCAALGQILLGSGRAPNLSESDPICSPPWLLDAFLVYRLPTLMPFGYQWEGSTEGDLLVLRGRGKDGHDLLIKHDPTEKNVRLYDRTTAYLLDGPKEVEKINFPLTAVFVETALACWQRHTEVRN